MNHSLVGSVNCTLTSQIWKMLRQRVVTNGIKISLKDTDNKHLVSQHCKAMQIVTEQ